MAHIRREFFEARHNDSQRAETALTFIKALYAIEEKARLQQLADENCFNINKLVNYCLDNQSVGNKIRMECVITKPGLAFHRLVATFVQASASFATATGGGLLNFQEHPTVFYYGRVFTFFPDNPGDILVDEM